MSLVRWPPNIRAIEEARLRRCWTLRRLSREARVSYPTIINLLLGRTKPNFGTLDQLGGALGLSPADLVLILDQPASVNESAQDLVGRGAWGEELRERATG